MTFTNAKRARQLLLAGVTTAWASLNMGACGGSNSTPPAKVDSAPDAGTMTSTQCRSDADCNSQLPVTVPADCASARCNILQGVCSFVAKDVDGDGHPAANCKAATNVTIEDGDDCNDHDPNLYPGHPEQCSALPNGTNIAWPTGAPVGICSYGQVACLADGTASNCAGAAAPETRDCTKNQDLDCDGTPDNQQCQCSLGPPAATQPCFQYPAPAMPGHGACASGVQTCAQTNGGAVWGACVGSVGPAGNDSCEPGNDNNCDGVPNNPPGGCGCTNGTQSTCGEALGAKGACAAGHTTCVNGAWGACDLRPAASDTCSQGDDSNCDGVANEGCACLTGQTRACGNCNTGTQDCYGGASPSGYNACANVVGCAPGTSAACTTCNGSSPTEFSQGTQVCSNACSYDQACVANAGQTKIYNADDAIADHYCGQSAGNGGWETASATCNCLLQHGPAFTLPAGSYTWTVSGMTYTGTASNPGGASGELLVTDNLGNSGTSCVAGATATFAVSASSASINFTVMRDCCPVYLEIEWLCKTPSMTGIFRYSLNQLAKG